MSFTHVRLMNSDLIHLSNPFGYDSLCGIQGAFFEEGYTKATCKNCIRLLKAEAKKYEEAKE